jgi:hypothetical protein
VQNVPPSEYRRRLARLALGGGTGIVTVTGSAEIGSSQITLTFPMPGLLLGMTLTGPGVPLEQTINAVYFTDTSTGVEFTPGIATATATNATYVAYGDQGGGPPAYRIHLTTGPVSPGPDPTPADFIEASFSGYSSLPCLPGTDAYTTNTGGAGCDAGLVSWVLATTPEVGQTISGYWIDYLWSAGETPVAVVAAWETFDAPIPMTQAGNVLVLSIPFTEPGLGSAQVLRSG